VGGDNEMKIWTKYLIICFSFLILTGCATTIPIKTADDVFNNSVVEIDPYQKTTWINSPTFSNFDGTGYYYAYLRALLTDKRYVDFYQLYVSDTSSNWRFYDRAYDSKGRKLDFLNINHQVTNNAMTEESFAIEFGRDVDYLERAKSDGLNIKVVGKQGERIIILPGFLFDGFLRKVDDYTKIK
jgi:hypothetical protein